MKLIFALVSSLVCGALPSLASSFMPSVFTVNHTASPSTETEEATQDVVYVCTLCGQPFPFASSLPWHMRFKHQTQATQESSVELPLEGVVVRCTQNFYPGMYYKCLKCGEYFTTREYVNAHLRITREKSVSCKTHSPDGMKMKSWMYGLSQDPTHEEEKAILCPECGLTFSDKFYLARHKRSMHSNKRHVCEVCSYATAHRRNLHRHQWAMHSRPSPCPRPFICEQCGKSFMDKVALCNHKRIHKPKSHLCHLCPQAFVTRFSLPYARCSSLLAHKKQQHGASSEKAEGEQQSLGEVVVRCRNEFGVSYFVCLKCNGYLPSRERMAAHIRIDSKGITCQKVCPSGSRLPWRQQVLLLNDNLSERKDFLCDSCGTTCKDKSTFLRHMATHYPDVPASLAVKRFKCELCSYSTNYRGYIQRHVLARHTPEPRPRPFVCDQCGKSYLDRSMLSQHRQQIHVRDKTFHCHFCPKFFYQKRLLTQHLRTHSGGHYEVQLGDAVARCSCEINGENPVHYYACLKCDLEHHTARKIIEQICISKEGEISCKAQHPSGPTLTVQNVDVTLEEHFGILAEWHCSQCDVRLIGLRRMEEHRKQHTPAYCCDVCGEGFLSRYRLNGHYARKHQTGPRALRWICDRCGLPLASKVGLKDHEKTHTENADNRSQLGENFNFTSEHVINPQQEIDEENPVHYYACLKCDLEHHTARKLIEHICVSNEGEISCQKQHPSGPTLTVQNVNVALKQQLGILPKWHCSQCDVRLIGLRQMEEHRKQHASTYACDVCGEDFLSLYKLNVHSASKHKTGPLARHWICDRCGQALSSQQGLRDHVQTHTEDAITKFNLEMQLDIAQDINGENKMHYYKCLKCDLEYYSAKRVVEHICIGKEGEISCKTQQPAGTILTARHKDLALEEHFGIFTQWHCTCCDVQLTGFKQMSMHKKQHTPTYCCDEADGTNIPSCSKCLKCDCTFLFSRKLVQHVRIGSNGELSCEAHHPRGPRLTPLHKRLENLWEELCTCAQSADNLMRNKMHFSAISFILGKPPTCLKDIKGENHVRYFKCLKCDEAYYSAKRLVEHVSIGGDGEISCHNRHAGGPKLQTLHHQKEPRERSWVCDHCGAAFFDRKILQDHKTVHSTVRAFACHLCPKRFRTGKTVGEPVTRTLYACVECRHPFLTTMSLQRHMQNSHSKPISTIPVSGDGEVSCDKKHPDGRRLSLRNVGAIVEEVFGIPAKSYCRKCNLYLSGTSLISRHYSQLHTRRFFCDICGVSIATSKGLKHHFVTKASRKSQGRGQIQEPVDGCLFVCLQCNKPTLSEKSVSYHLANAHKVLVEASMEAQWCEVLLGDVIVKCSLESADMNRFCAFRCRQCDTEFCDVKYALSHCRINTEHKLTCKTVCSDGQRLSQHYINMLRLHAFKSWEQNLLCDLCGTVLTSQLELKEHQKRQHTSFKCDLCSFVAPKFKAMTDHVSAQHAVESAQRWVCDQCGQSYRQKHLLVLHERSVHAKEKAFACSNDTTANNSTETEEPVTVTLYLCPVCYKPHSRGESLPAHMRRYHEYDQNESVQVVAKEASLADVLKKCNVDSESGRLSYYQCLKCQTEARTVKKALLHICISKDDGTVSCRKVCRNGLAMTVHYMEDLLSLRFGILRSYLCEECGVACNTKSEHEQHERVHRRLYCETCGFSTPDRGTLKKHYFRKHKKGPKERPFVCDVCGKAFCFKKDLQSHKTEEPVTVTLYLCPVCYKPHSRGESLPAHMRRYHEYDEYQSVKVVAKEVSLADVLSKCNEYSKAGGLRYYKCLKCQTEGYTVKKALLHIRVSKDDGSITCKKLCPDGLTMTEHYMEDVLNLRFGIVRNYLCEECGAACRTKKEYDQHERVHRRLYCETCGFSTPDRGTLKRHCVTHKKGPKERPFVCDLCGKAFCAKQQLKNHSDSFHSTVQLQCHICLKYYRGKKLLHAEEPVTVTLYLCPVCYKPHSRGESLPALMRRDHEHDEYQSVIVVAKEASLADVLKKCYVDSESGRPSYYYKCLKLMSEARTVNRVLLHICISKDDGSITCKKLCPDGLTMTAHYMEDVLSLRFGIVRNYLCDECGVECKTKSEHKQHEQIHRRLCCETLS
ncbi:hypothetical protein BaRGS_00013556, partial [Batillaria attramentaria]